MLEFCFKKRENVFTTGWNLVGLGNKMGLVATTEAQLKLVVMNLNRNESV